MFRRGKLAFMSSKDDRIKIINERVNLTERHLIEICCAFSECTRKLAKQRDAYDELAKVFKNYADNEDMHESFSEGLKRLTNAVTILGDYMDVNVFRLEKKIVNELTQYDNLLKTTRDNIRSAVLARDKEVLKQRQLNEIKIKFSANNTAADSELLKAKMEVNRTNKEIDDIISNFEMRKLTDIKTVLTDFVLISLKYHTKALEALSACYYDVSNIDERSDFIEFQKLMKSKDETQSVKTLLKKGLRSQSLDNLDTDEMPSPVQRRGHLSRSTKNLTDRAGNEAENDEDEDDDEEEESEESTNTDEDDSGTVSEAEDADDVSEVSANAKSKGKLDKTIKPRTQTKLPFRAVAGSGPSHVIKYDKRQIPRYRPFAVKSGGGVGIPKGNSSQNDGNNAPGSNHRENKAPKNFGGTSGRLVTVVETKKKSEVAQKEQNQAEVIDCSSGRSGRARK